MGTGTSFVRVKNNVPTHLGGIGIGGGTITGLSKLMLSTNDVDKIQEMAQEGKVGNIDLRIGDCLLYTSFIYRPSSFRQDYIYASMAAL